MYLTDHLLAKEGEEEKDRNDLPRWNKVSYYIFISLIILLFQICKEFWNRQKMCMFKSINVQKHSKNLNCDKEVIKSDMNERAIDNEAWFINQHTYSDYILYFADTITN